MASFTQSVELVGQAIDGIGVGVIALGSVWRALAVEVELEGQWPWKRAAAARGKAAP